MSGRHIRLPIIAILGLLLSAHFASAQQYFNNYQYVIGERAAGLGGAYTAIANDSTSLWYNPAGLAKIQDFHLNISANTYSYLKTKTEGYWQLPKQGGGTESINMEESDFSVVANTLIFGKKLGERQAVSFGLIIPYQDTLLGTMEAKGITDPGGNTLSFKDETSLVSKYYLAMLGYGAQIDNDLNVGASVGLGYYKATLKDSWLLYYTDSSTFEFLDAANTTIDDTQYTMQLGIGTQMEIDRNQKLGFYAQTPTYRISGETTVKDFSCTVDNSSYSGGCAPQEEKSKDDPFKQVLPAFVSLGYGYERPGSLGFSLDIVPVFPVSGGESDAKNTVVNIKAGLEKYLSDSMIVRGGLFTDFSQKDDVKATVETPDGTDKIDFYGGTLSLSFAKHFSGTEAKKEGNKTTYTPVKRSLWSTFGIVTRYGKGDVKVTRFDADYNEIPQIKEKSVLNFQVFIAEAVAF